MDDERPAGPPCRQVGAEPGEGVVGGGVKVDMDIFRTSQSPTTVVQARTRQRTTSPWRTYGSATANASATAGESPRKSSTALSTGSASAPARTSSPRAWAARASA